MDVMEKKSQEEKRISRSQYSKEERKNKKATTRANQDHNFFNMIQETGYIYNIFGSPDGNDIDILVLVNEKISQLNKNQLDRLCILYSEHFKLLYSNLSVDINLILVEEYKIIWVAHGTIWETNNALFATYDLHTQKYKCFVNNNIMPTTTEINNKLHKAVRNILSMYIRSIQYRNDVKKALNSTSTLNERLNVVLSIDNSRIIWADNRNNIVKINKQTKRACYQTLQALSSINTPGLYTKQDLCRSCPTIKNFLYHNTLTEIDYVNLNLVFTNLANVIYDRNKLCLIDLNGTEL
jgi:hypothetical protein